MNNQIILSCFFVYIYIYIYTSLQIKKLTHSIKELTKQVAELRAEKQSTQAGASAAEAEYLQSTQAARTHFEQQIESHRKSVHHAANTYQEAQITKREAEARLQQVQGAVQVARQQEAGANRRVLDAQGSLHRLRQGQGRPPAVKFGGEKTVRLLELVERAVQQGKFHRRPIGPIGSLLSLTDAQWGVPIEVRK